MGKPKRSGGPKNVTKVKAQAIASLEKSGSKKRIEMSPKSFQDSSSNTSGQQVAQKEPPAPKMIRKPSACSANVPLPKTEGQLFWPDPETEPKRPTTLTLKKVKEESQSDANVKYYGLKVARTESTRDVVQARSVAGLQKPSTEILSKPVQQAVETPAIASLEKSGSKKRIHTPTESFQNSSSNTYRQQASRKEPPSLTMIRKPSACSANGPLPKTDAQLFSPDPETELRRPPTGTPKKAKEESAGHVNVKHHGLRVARTESARNGVRARSVAGLQKPSTEMSSKPAQQTVETTPTLQLADNPRLQSRTYPKVAIEHDDETCITLVSESDDDEILAPEYQMFLPVILAPEYQMFLPVAQNKDPFDSIFCCVNLFSCGKLREVIESPYKEGNDDNTTILGLGNGRVLEPSSQALEDTLMDMVLCLGA